MNGAKFSFEHSSIFLIIISHIAVFESLKMSQKSILESSFEAICAETCSGIAFKYLFDHSFESRYGHTLNGSIDQLKESRIGQPLASSPSFTSAPLYYHFSLTCKS
jgi:hypothetical protein